MTKSINAMIDDLIAREGDYVNHPADRGGPTRFGITEANARAAGYRGDMRQLPKELATRIYWGRFVTSQGIDLLAKRSPRLAAEALDSGVNMGAPWGVMFLQEALNVFNREGKDWPDLPAVDGVYGPRSDAALARCQVVRAGQQWEDVLLAAMNCLQGARYIAIAKGRPSQEAFTWGWMRNRVLAPA